MNPRSAPAFKGIFTQGTKDSELALKSFLSAMLGREVVHAELEPNEPPVDEPGQMQMSFDVAVRFDNGEQKKALENAINLLKLNILTMEQISQTTTLLLEKVCELAAQIESK